VASQEHQVAAVRERPLRHASSDRPALGDPDVQRLLADVAPGDTATDLGGTMSLNLRLHAARLVLRVHRPLLSRARLVALQRVRRRLSDMGLVVPAPLAWRGATLFRCGARWAELEPYVESSRPEPSPDAYAWLFGAMGRLHKALAALDPLDVAVPRPIIATYGPPSTLLRWLPAAEAAVRHDSEAIAVLRRVRVLVGRLRAAWVPANALPVQLVHGDIRLGNVRRTADGTPVYFDFGFLANRPRIHDVAYALSWMILRPDSRGTAEGFPWQTVPALVAGYEAAAGVELTPLERRALGVYTAAVPLYLLSVAAFVPDPVAHVRNDARLVFLRIGEWLLAYPDVMAGAH